MAYRIENKFAVEEYNEIRLRVFFFIQFINLRRKIIRIKKKKPPNLIYIARLRETCL